MQACSNRQQHSAAGLKRPPPLEPASNGGAAPSAPPPLVPPVARTPSPPQPSETATPEAIRDGIVDYLRKKPGSKGGWLAGVGCHVSWVGC